LEKGCAHYDEIKEKRSSGICLAVAQGSAERAYLMDGTCVLKYPNLVEAYYQNSEAVASNERPSVGNVTP